MKKILLAITSYFSYFLIPLTLFSLFLIYVMFKVPIAFWLGHMAGKNYADNAGGMILQFLKNDYLIFFFSPLLPILAAYLILTLFIWIYYRDDKKTSRTGFAYMIITLFAGFSLAYMPIKASNLSFKVQEEREGYLKKINKTDEIFINKNLNKEFLKLYQTLADDGLQEWRRDPIKVAEYELSEGDLTYLSHGENKLTLVSLEEDKVNKKSKGAIIKLMNEQLEAEIYLNSYWEKENGIWMVKGYKKL